MYCYHALPLALQTEWHTPQQRLAYAVHSTLQGLVDHRQYLVQVQELEQRPTDTQLARQFRLLRLLDGNPLTSLFATGLPEATFLARWNQLQRWLQLGVKTWLDDRPSRVRRDSHIGPDDPLRPQVIAHFIDCWQHALPDAGLLSSHLQQLDLQQQATGELAQLLLYQPGLELAACAQTLGCSVRTLQRQLQSYGVPFARLRQAIRLQRATQALLTGTQGMTDIALDCGYFDAAHFNHQWKLSTGLTPQQYRSLHQLH
ncbi:helix-turn-helix transcriptional regulator [Leeia aquatica]|uniref:AraC family transcriptional regulator n=1 Tax=Leeia aquatica TaxID=2725557 RepID=A0A847SIP8_9NEIS|nr:helix-turn-helix transcriptional regulator [Leeia aquatica]NLR75762.1 AraC family transcriptional regulator [Leeia aquatica]